MKTLLEVLQSGTDYLARQGCDEARATMQHLMAHVLHCNRTALYSRFDRPVEEAELAPLRELLKRRAAGEPLQHLLGFTEFFRRDFLTDARALIPRPETEELVEIMLKEISSTSRVLDIGTGSGCIAATLAKELPGAQVTAWDVSEEALAIAAANSLALQVPVCFEQRDVLTYTPGVTERYDVIVSNPPYVTEAEKQDMERNVLDWEPSLALFVPDADPLRFYRRISVLGLEMLEPDGKLYFEINRTFGEDIVLMMRELGYRFVRLQKDISHNDRFVIAQK